MKIIFVVDYSADDKGHFVIYEIQPLIGSDNYALSNNRSLNKWCEKLFYEKINAYEKLCDLPISLNSNKALQRTLLGSFSKTQQYNPDYLILNPCRVLKENDKAKIRAFYNKHDGRIVAKTPGVLGFGNSFSRNLTFDKFYKQIKNTPYFTSIVLESELMYSPQHYHREKYTHNNKNPGLYRRDIVIYDANNPDETEHYEVYKNLIDINRTTDNHDHYSGSNYHEKGYFDTSITSQEKRLSLKREKHPQRYQQRKNFFSDIGFVVNEYINKNINIHNIKEENFLRRKDHRKTTTQLESASEDLCFYAAIHEIRSYEKHKKAFSHSLISMYKYSKKKSLTPDKSIAAKKIVFLCIIKTMDYIGNHKDQTIFQDELDNITSDETYYNCLQVKRHPSASKFMMILTNIVTLFLKKRITGTRTYRTSGESKLRHIKKSYKTFGLLKEQNNENNETLISNITNILEFV